MPNAPICELGLREGYLLDAILQFLPASDRCRFRAVCRVWYTCETLCTADTLVATLDLVPLLDPTIHRMGVCRQFLPQCTCPCNKEVRDAGGRHCATVFRALHQTATVTGPLRHLDLRGVDYGTVFIAGGDEILSVLLSRSHPTLRSLHLRDFPCRAEAWTEAFAAYPPIVLETLDLRGCQEAPLHLLLPHCPALTELNGRGVDQHCLLRSLSKDTIPPNLRKLTIGWHTEYNGGKAGQGFAELYNLFEINEALVDVSPLIAPNLTRLELPGFGMAQRGLRPYVDCTKLQTVDLCNCSYIDDTYVVPLLQNNPNLECINLRNTAISESTMEAMGQNCPLLKALNVSLTMVGDSGILWVVEKCPLVESIDLCYTRLPVSPAAVRKIAANYCEQLRLLGIGGNNISDDDLAYVVQHCPSIEHLGIGGCQYLSVRLWDILLGLPDLRCLLVHNLRVIPFDAVMRLIRERGTLRGLDLYYVLPSESMTRSQLEWLETHYPFDWVEDWNASIRNK
eukprot:Sspe_Gene.35915::Locus_17392_Transcript_1_1_Confidence_1.000_Length_1612::g.35915::m.35915